MWCTWGKQLIALFVFHKYDHQTAFAELRFPNAQIETH